MKKNGRKIIGLVISLVLIILLSHPAWLPLPASTKDALAKVLTQNFSMSHEAGISFARILGVVLAVSVIWFVCGVLNLIFTSITVKRSHTRTIISLVLSFVKYAGVLVGLIWVLSILGMNVSAILASIGILSLIIGFGAQSLIEDVITGIFIIFEGHYNIGDIIVLGDFRGVVRDIEIRTTVIEDVGGNLKVINNSDIRNFQNRSRNSSLAICEIDITYEEDIRKLEELFKKELPKLLENRKGLYLSAPRYRGVQNIAESGITLRFAVDCKEEDIFDATRALNRDIKLLFDDNGIEIPFPQVVVHNGKYKEV
ncbi:MAG: mechanosensitive ion channel family protein [Lachnospiraceae bacterium]|nr:mechanosensitive ion channel family protein [Lachnospiraceae bacterium]